MASAKKSAPGAHRWSFYRAGGVDQVRLDRAEDILNLDQLDQKLWVALSCPVRGLEFDERTLQLLDSDGDGRVRAPEILDAVRWLRAVLAKPDGLIEGCDGLPLSAIDTSTPEGARLAASAKHMLESLGKPEGPITVADTDQMDQILTSASLNGDGVVVPEAVDDVLAGPVALEIVQCTGGVPDRSGKVGFDKALLDAFFADCEAFVAWRAAAEADEQSLLPLGAETAKAAEAVQAVRAKVDDYFARGQLAAFDARAQAALNRQESAYLEIAARDMTLSAEELRDFPLAQVEADKPLPLEQGLNPAWVDAVARLREQAVRPLLGQDKHELTRADWLELCAKLAPFRSWSAAKAGASVEGLGLERVRKILAGKSRVGLEEAIAADLAVAPEVDDMQSVEKLVRLYRDFHTLLNNYVSFTNFYSRKKAIFQAGTLYLDGRSCDLCVHVNDAGKHATLAPMSKTYLTYVECTRPSGEKMQIAAAFTSGNSDNLFVGRNGLFYDRKGRDWDATIQKIVDNPIGIGQAFWSPYKKALRWVEEQVAKRAAAADSAADAKLQSTAAGAGEASRSGTAAPPKKMDIGVLAAISVAISGVTVVLGGLLQGFFGLGYLMPLGILGLMLLISGPAMVIAWLKLRQRNLGPILDANGWAVNALTLVNIPLGRSLTELGSIPPGSSRSLVDPYAPKKSVWPRVLLVLLLLAAVGYGLWRTGYLHRWWPDCPLPAPAVAAESAGPAEGAQDAPASTPAAPSAEK